MTVGRGLEGKTSKFLQDDQLENPQRRPSSLFVLNTLLRSEILNCSNKLVTNLTRLPTSMGTFR